MGRPIADRLLDAFGELTVWNRSGRATRGLAPAERQGTGPRPLSRLDCTQLLRVLGGGAEDAGAKRGMQLPLSLMLKDIFEKMVSDGRGELDHSAVELTIADASRSGRTSG